MSADAQRARLERERLEFLTELYNLSEGDLNREIDVGEIIDNLGISYEHVRIITRFFLEERLVFVHWAPPISDEALKAGIPQKVARVRITAKGIKEIEQALRRPDKPTKHFSPPSVILNITGGMFNNSPFQVASRNSTQNLTIAPNNLAEINRLLTELKEIQNDANLGQETKEELDANTRILRIQSKKEIPKRERITCALSSLKSILEESPETVSTTATTASLATKIGSMLTGMDSGRKQ